MKWHINLPLLFVTILVTISIVFGCTEPIPPPGGEPDKTGPYLLSTEPSDGSLNVTPGNRIILVFSERLVKSEKDNPLFISPRPFINPEVKWKGNKIEIEFDEPFEINQTYIVSLGAGITDLRRNNLDSNTSIAFSTGDKIDSGKIIGQITKDLKPVAGVKIGLFDKMAFDKLIPIDSIYPIYLTTSDKSGNFELRYLPDGSYQLIGFQDNNHDDRLNISKESYALTDREIEIKEGKQSDTLLMSLTNYDTTTISIASVAVQNSGLIRIRMTTGIPLKRLVRDPEALKLIDNNDSSLIYLSLGVLESDSSVGNRITAYFGNLPQSSYRLEMNLDTDDSLLTFDSLTIKKTDDKTPPQIEKFLPGDKPVFDSETDIIFTFSEPIDTLLISDQTFALWQADKILPYTMKWNNPFKLTLVPVKKLSSGKKYRLDLTEFDIYDITGNMLGDSLRSFNISVLGKDSLGSISGQVMVRNRERKNNPIHLAFVESQTARKYKLILSGKQLSNVQDIYQGDFIINLPPGKYTLNGFIDSDNDGKMSPGAVIPYQPAESFAIYSDTISVRARFETAGIEMIFK